MTADILDLGIIVLIVLSAVIGLVRGFVREALSLATWIAAASFAVLYFDQLAEHVPFAVQSKIARIGIAFAVIFLGVLVIGSIINYILSAAVSSVGLGGVDRVLGGAFGILRGGLIITLLVLLMVAMTPFPKSAWWKDSRLMPWFENNAVIVKEMIPKDLSSQFAERFSGNGDN